jgi:glucose-1-phosphate cytidylyltransferase
MEVHENFSEPWRVTLVDTGSKTMTGGRLKRISSYLDTNETFCLTYGDGLSDINIKELIKFHMSHGKNATLTSVIPEGRFGVLDVDNNNKINMFTEKPSSNKNLINAGFFVLSSSVIKYIKDDDTVWEKEPLESLAKAGELMSYFHDGFWQPMDTLRDKNLLEDLWNSAAPPWKISK